MNNLQYLGEINFLCSQFLTYVLLKIMKVKEMDFMAKGRFESYRGNILYYTYGMDLSGNKLTGPIPCEIGCTLQTCPTTI